MVFKIESLRLLVQEEDVPVRRTARRGSRTDPVGDEGRVKLKQGRVGDLRIGLDPVQNGTQNPEGGEGSIDVEAHDHIFGIGLCAGEEELRGFLGVCVCCELRVEISKH